MRNVDLSDSFSAFRYTSTTPPLFSFIDPNRYNYEIEVYYEIILALNSILYQ